MTDPMRQQHLGLNDALGRLTANMRALDDDLVTVPAHPLSDKPDELMATKPLSRAERKRDYLTTRSNPLLIKALAEEARANYNLPDHKPLSRQVVRYFIEGERDFGGDR